MKTWTAPKSGKFLHPKKLKIADSVWACRGGNRNASAAEDSTVDLNNDAAADRSTESNFQQILKKLEDSKTSADSQYRHLL